MEERMYLARRADTAVGGKEVARKNIDIPETGAIMMDGLKYARSCI